MFEAHGPRIMIVEDDPSVLELLTTRLELAGYRTSVARNGLLALDLLRTMTPDAIVLDLNMPGLDGFGVLAALGKKPPKSRPPVLVLTARNAAADVQKCLSLGAKDYLAKPFDDQKLLARVARLVRRRGPEAADAGPPGGAPATAPSGGRPADALSREPLGEVLL